MPAEDTFYNESEAKAFLQSYEQTTQVVWNKFMEATWNYVTNITKKNREEMLHKDMERSQHILYFGTQAHQFNITTFRDPVIKRMLKKVQDMDKAALPEEELREYNKLLASMEMMYSMAEVCMEEGPCLYLEPDLQEVMATSRDQKELLWAWQGWRDAVGRPLRLMFERYVELSNKAAMLNGYKDMGALWRTMYDSEDKNSTLEHDLEQLFQELRPLYLNLHAYVRHALYRHYGPERINLKGPIPAHLLGNMWAQSWVNILDLVLPFPEKPLEDSTKIMKSQRWKPNKMFQEADKFFTSLGLLPAPPEFWSKSMLEKPVDGREVVCHTSAWDFYNGQDFRIKKCTEVTMEDLISVFHHMGHIQYFLQYKNLSVIFREGANPAFEEAVGSAVTLSASSHKHLLNIGLLSSQFQDSEDEVNFLMGIALEKIAFIPFGYLVDLYRWKVFDGTIHKHIYNQEWWSLRDALKLGSSKPWPEVLKKLTGESQVSTKALMTYFKPLLNWLVTENVRQGEILGWSEYNCYFEGEGTDTVSFLGLQLNTDQAKRGQWVLLVLSLVMALTVLMLGCILYKRSTAQDTGAYFLGMAMEPHQAAQGQWILLGFCLLLIVCSISLTIMIFIQHKKPPWMRAEWWGMN
ncbi:angiotensin-converting enzyme-like protein Ace3 [Orycteropus afer afer]|uniref:Angiotensin-converting enzyme n=1 Tax=Orycteropus afer afer TaxID=1230840 RepID=A0A8B7BD66_ORYAF|nr:angiotensin-converting enzyme-like protein Ace3 [Orycteropus afer afer]